MLDLQHSFRDILTNRLLVIRCYKNISYTNDKYYLCKLEIGPKFSTATTYKVNELLEINFQDTPDVSILVETRKSYCCTHVYVFLASSSGDCCKLSLV